MAPYPQSITSFGSSEAQKSYNEEENCQEYRESRSIGKSASAESSSVICCFFQSIKSLLCFGLVVAVIVVISVVLAAVFSGQSVSGKYCRGRIDITTPVTNLPRLPAFSRQDDSPQTPSFSHHIRSTRPIYSLRSTRRQRGRAMEYARPRLSAARNH